MNVKLGYLLNQVRENKPLIHHITNYVTVNDCANITLAIGASPVMADAIDEAADIAAIASAVVLNMGTLNERTIPSMIAAGKAANQKCVPVVFDPVGVGASNLRNKTAKDIVDAVKLGVIRGNISEIKFIAGLSSQTKGVDASESDMENTVNPGDIAKDLAQKLGCVVVISGAIDTISDGEQIVYIKNGHAMLGGLTGTGCMCTSLIGCFCGAHPNQPFEAAVAAMACMGIAGELAQESCGGPKQGSFHMELRNMISGMDDKTLEGRVKYGKA